MVRRALLLLLGMALLAPVEPADALRRKTSAVFYFRDHNVDNNCTWGAGIDVTPVAKAIGYTVTYYDGYHKREITQSFSASNLPRGPGAPKGTFQVGITGGGYSPPCGASDFSGLKTRFPKPAKAWAIFPDDYKPKGSLKVKVAAPAGGATVGETVAVDVTVTAGDLPVTNVSLGRGLRGGGSIAGVVKRPRRLSGFKLGAGGSKTFTFSVKARGKGAAALRAAASGRTKRGRVSGKGADTLRIAESQLALTMSVAPLRPRLQVDREGKVLPTTVTVTAKVTNAGTTPVENVTLQSLRPVPVRRGDRLDQIAIAGGALPAELGTVAPRAVATRQFPLVLTGDGSYEIKGLVTYADAGGGTGRIAETGGRFEALVPPLYLKLARDPANIEDRGGAPWIGAGKTWYLNGKLVNLSDHKRLCVYPLIPALTGNAAATGPVDITERGIRDVGGPFAGAVGPGKDAVLQMFVETGAGGGTSSQVAFKPRAGLLKSGQRCNDETWRGLDKLGPEDIALPEGAEFAVHVDVSTPVKAPDPVGKAGFFFLGIGRSLAVDTVQQVLDLVALARQLPSIQQQYGFLSPIIPGTAVYATIRSWQALSAASDMYATWWRTATAAEKSSILRRVGRFVSVASNDFVTHSSQAVREAAEPFMAKLEKAYAEGDDRRIGFLWGQVGGTLIQNVFLGEFLKLGGAAIASDAAKIERRAAEAADAWKAREAARALDAETAAAGRVAKETVPPGTPLGRVVKAVVWGVDEATDAALKSISAKWNVLIGVRSRAAGSIKKLKLGSVWKHENLKPKNVSSIDTKYLGFAGEHLDEVRFRTYTDEQVAFITNRVTNDPTLTARQKIAILDRFETRLHEGERYLSKIQEFSRKGEINVGFNYRDNGIQKATTRNVRRFQLDGTEAGAIGDLPPGGMYYTPLQENLDLYRLRRTGKLPGNCKRLLRSVLCTVTGDVDGVYVTLVDGSAVPPDVLVKIYKELADAGWQHPETLTWVDSAGNFLFGSKADILKELEVGGQAMVEYAPDGVTRATYLNLKQSALLSNDNFRLRVVGGFSDTVPR